MTKQDSDKPRLSLTHPDEVYATANTPPTWDDLCAIARFDVHVWQAVRLAESGRVTREQALLALAVSLAKAKNSLMQQHVELMNRTPMPRIVFPE
jgi:hypothetical protein